MDYELYPLAVTQVEWSIFIDVCQRIFGISPTRGIDSSHLEVKDPAAFLGSLDIENAPIEALRDSFNPGHQHFSVSFILVADADGAMSLINTGLKIYTKVGPRKKNVTILTGTMDVWHRAILNGCRDVSSYELRVIMNLALARFEQAGFREVFSHLTKHQKSDGTFILRT